jgi:hypothetical protein
MAQSNVLRTRTAAGEIIGRMLEDLETSARRYAATRDAEATECEARSIVAGAMLRLGDTLVTHFEMAISSAEIDLQERPRRVQTSARLPSASVLQGPWPEWRSPH